MFSFVFVTESHLEGEWRSVKTPALCYEIVERDARMEQGYWGGYVRHNALYRKKFDLASGEFLEEEFLFTNDAIMMYSPLLPETDIRTKK